MNNVYLGFLNYNQVSLIMILKRTTDFYLIKLDSYCKLENNLDLYWTFVKNWTHDILHMYVETGNQLSLTYQ